MSRLMLRRRVISRLATPIGDLGYMKSKALNSLWDRLGRFTHNVNQERFFSDTN